MTTNDTNAYYGYQVMGKMEMHDFYFLSSSLFFIGPKRKMNSLV